MPDDADYQALRRERLRRLRSWRSTAWSSSPPQLHAGRAARAAVRARRSRATIASRAGARSASGRACGSARARPRAAEAAGALRRVPLRRSDGRHGRHDSATTRASTSTTRYHPQTILAYELNDKPLPVANGAPLRLRVERQLGYKHGEVRDARSSWSRASRTSAAARAATGKTRATSGTRGI